MVEVGINELYATACLSLKEVSQDCALEAQFLIKGVLGFDFNDIALGKAVVDKEQENRFMAALQKRTLGYPLQYIIGEWDFFGLSFEVGEGVLIPRADTEVLVEATLKACTNGHVKILDLCSGSGCIAISLSKRLLDAEIYAIEKSEKAFSFLKRNIQKNDAKVTPILADALCYAFDPKMEFDIIVSNPPYLSNEDMEALQREVCFEPSMALLGGADGLDFYRALTSHWVKSLKTGGILLYEIGFGQEKEIEKIMLNNRLSSSCFYKDLCGIIRTVSAVKPKQS